MPQKQWNPEEYDKQCIMQYLTAMNMLNSLTLKGSEKIIDIGSGTGKISFQIAKFRIPNGFLLGIDINMAMIEYGKNKYKTDNLRLKCKDVLNLDYRDYFDVAISFWTLSWIPLKDQVLALNNIIQSLKEGGYLFLMYPLRHDAYDVVENVITKSTWSKYFEGYQNPRNFITEEQYREEVLIHLPIELHLEKKELECEYRDDKEMMDSINCWLAHVDEIPFERKSEFLLDVVDTYKAHRNTPKPVMYYSILELSGYKNSYQNTLRMAF